MAHTMSRSVGWVVAFALLSAAPAWAQWQPGSLVVRTSGSVMRPGECLRVELLALETVAAPFTVQLSYRFNEPFIVKDDQGNETRQTRERLLTRPANPAIEQLERFRALVLDDALCFGENTPPGRYLLEATLSQSGAKTSSGMLRSCVLYDGTEVRPDARADTGSGCGLFVRGLARVDGTDSLVFDGDFPDLGTYRAVAVRAGRIYALADGAVTTNGRHELFVNAAGLPRNGSDSIDLVLHEQLSGATTTLGRLVLPPPR